MRAHHSIFASCLHWLSDVLRLCLCRLRRQHNNAGTRDDRDVPAKIARSPVCHMAFPLAPAQAALLPLAAGGTAARRAAAGAQPPLAASDARVCAPRLARPRSRRGASIAAAATTPAKDRGEWTRFLEFSGDSTRASVDCILLPGGRAAEVTVVAPDRPGLLSDIAAAIASLGLTIDKARTRCSVEGPCVVAARCCARPALPLPFAPHAPQLPGVLVPCAHVASAGLGPRNAAGGCLALAFPDRPAAARRPG